MEKNKKKKSKRLFTKAHAKKRRGPGINSGFNEYRILRGLLDKIFATFDWRSIEIPNPIDLIFRKKRFSAEPDLIVKAIDVDKPDFDRLFAEVDAEDEKTKAENEILACANWLKYKNDCRPFIKTSENAEILDEKTKASLILKGNIEEDLNEMQNK